MDKFDSKFDQITTELSKLKTENIQLKERERASKLRIKELEDEKDDIVDRLRFNEKQKYSMEAKMTGIESDMRSIV